MKMLNASGYHAVTVIDDSTLCMYITMYNSNQLYNVYL